MGSYQPRTSAGHRNHGCEEFYFPGGRRKPRETDVQALTREIAEELTVAIIASTISYFGTYEAQRPGDTIARMTCYFADHNGSFAPANEIAEMAWIKHNELHRTSPLDQLVIDALQASGHLA